jgi:hydrogenase maturation protease
VLVIGLGNEVRGDDAVGIEVARRVHERAADLEVIGLQGEPVGLLGAWLGATSVVVVDSMRSGAAPGTIRRFDATAEPVPGQLNGTASTHAIGAREAIELARILDRLPANLIVYAVEGHRFEIGAGLSVELRPCVPRLVSMVLDEVRELAACAAPEPAA